MSSKLHSETLLTEQETAAFLKVKIYSLRKWRREGSGPCYIRCGGRLIRYVEGDIISWLKTNSFDSSAAELLAATNVQ